MNRSFNQYVFIKFYQTICFSKNLPLWMCSTSERQMLLKQPVSKHSTSIDYPTFLVHKSICETVCGSASWHGAQESKLTLFTAHFSNFDSNNFLCPHSDFSASAFYQFMCLWLQSASDALRCFCGNTSTQKLAIMAHVLEVDKSLLREETEHFTAVCSQKNSS